ncbi:uncharacterized protein LOC101859832 [Aplysia californica]|uniref:Uncharacterized protein LOC101859832 n=1 Tax=Aplysia californica TaxID=6500 RepID=A0ABM0K994_APLCA|nr:uncharacterized protein LOC101859832 [Aplysia californica]
MSGSLPENHVTLLLFFSLTISFPAALCTIQSCHAWPMTQLVDKVTDTWLIREVDLGSSKSRLDCARLCVSMLACTSFMVNHSTRRCRLHAHRLTDLDIFRPDLGFVTYETSRAPGAVGSKCTTDIECAMNNSLCLSGQCQCQATHSYSPNSRSCVTECPEYGQEFTVFPNNYITGNNLQVFIEPEMITPEACEAACLAYTLDVCRSIDLDYDLQMCLVSNETSFTAPASFIYYVKNIFYHQRQCAYQD